MFKRLRNRFLLINLAVTSVIIFIAFAAIYFASYSSVMKRPLPPRPENDTSISRDFNNQLRNERKATLDSLLFALIIVGITVEGIVAILSFFLAEAVIKPVKSAYDSQRNFVANASHEIKTPLAAISANLEAADIKNNRWIRNALSEVDNLTALNQQLLLLAQAEQIPIDTTTAKTSAVLSDILSSFAPQFKQKSIAPEIQIKSPSPIAKTDFRQIATILIDNALKYSDKTIVITLSANQLSITNDGATISTQELPHIFERFYQTDKTASGVGLGLAIAKAIADRNGWQLTAKSSDTTTFQLTF